MARVLIDQSAPRRIAKFLTGHTVDIAYDQGWSTLANGALLRAVEAGGYDVLLTADKNIQYQQNLSGRRLAIVVIGTNTWPVIAANPDPIRQAVDNAQRGSLTHVSYPKTLRPRGPVPN